MQNQFLINGSQNGSLTPMDRGFAYGDGVFRTLAVRQGRPHCWSLHYRKLNDDCNALGIVCPTQDVLLADIRRLCGDEDDAALKIVVTRGESLRGYAVPPLAQPNRALIKSPFPDYPERNFSHGINLHLCQLRLSLQPRLAGIKHLNRLENVLARMEWVDAQIADGLLLDTAGNVIECTMSNLFMRTGRLLTTPDLALCGVAGVTRQRIIEQAGKLGFRVETASFGLNDLLRADEAIICNSLYGAWQIRTLNEAIWPSGPLAANLRELLQEEDASAA
jgi:4-amino-4-deoxychorismate lyase